MISLEEGLLYEKSKYGKDLAEVNFIQEKLTTDRKDGCANYKITVVSAAASGFVGLAITIA